MVRCNDLNTYQALFLYPTRIPDVFSMLYKLLNILQHDQIEHLSGQVVFKSDHVESVESCSTGFYSRANQVLHVLFVRAFYHNSELLLKILRDMINPLNNLKCEIPGAYTPFSIVTTQKSP